MQNAVDAATLAAARAYSNGVSEEDLSDIVADIIGANLRTIADGAGASEVTSVVTVTGDVVEVSARSNVPNQILSAFDFDGFDVSVDAAATSDTTLPPLDVALVVDVSGSMDSQLGPLRDGIRLVAEKLHDIVEGNDDVRIAIVPYAHAVNIGANAPQSWLDVDAQSQYHGVNFEGHNFGHTSDCGDYGRTHNGSWISGTVSDFDPDTSEWCRDKFSPDAVNHFDLFDGISGVSVGRMRRSASEWSGRNRRCAEPGRSQHAVRSLLRPG